MSSPLFNIPSRTAAAPASTPAAVLAGSPPTPPPEPPPPVPVFTAGQSVITFPAASGIITVLWKLCGAFSSELAQAKWVPLALALLFGALIYWQSEANGTTPKEKALGFIYALINSLSLAATALGIDATSNPAPNAAPTP